MPTHKKTFWQDANKKSQCKLLFATTFFLASSGFAVYVLSQMATKTLTELIYLTATMCTVQELELRQDPVPCIIPSCGNILTQAGCRQTGYCLRMTVNFTVSEQHARDLNMPIVQSSSVPMLDLQLRDDYKDAHGIACTGYRPGIDGDRVCRPTKQYDTGKYLPSAHTEPNVSTGADGRVLELVDTTDSGPCAAITCREDGNVSLREAQELMTYWPVGSVLPTCYYLRSFDDVDRYLNSGSAPVIMAKTFELRMVGIFVLAAVASFCVSTKLCLTRLQAHHDLGDQATNKDFLYGVAGTQNVGKLRSLRA